MDYGYDYSDVLASTGYDKEIKQISEALTYNRGYKFGWGPPELQKEGRDQNLDYEPGVHSRGFEGSPDRVELAMEQFHQKMEKKYNEYKVISVTPIRNKQCITFSVGEKKPGTDNITWKKFR